MDDFRQYVLTERKKRHKAWMRKTLKKIPGLLTDFLAAMIVAGFLLMSAFVLYVLLLVMCV